MLQSRSAKGCRHPKLGVAGKAGFSVLQNPSKSISTLKSLCKLNSSTLYFQDHRITEWLGRDLNDHLMPEGHLPLDQVARSPDLNFLSSCRLEQFGVHFVHKTRQDPQSEGALLEADAEWAKGSCDPRQGSRSQLEPVLQKDGGTVVLDCRNW